MTHRPTNIYFAVFNSHINNADKRARALMRALYPEWLEEVEKIEAEKNGLMAIFSSPQTTALTFYAGLVTAYVNQDFDPKPRLYTLDEMTAALADDPELRDILTAEMRKRL